MKRAALSRLIAFDTVVTVVALDQITKYLIVSDVFEGHKAGFLTWLFSKAERIEAAPQKITEFLNLDMVWNRGISFGMLQSGSDMAGYILSAIAAAVAAGFGVWVWRSPDFFKSAAGGLIIGGALGNIWDRLRFGAVADFVDVHVAGWHWPAFNVADSAVCVGVALLLAQQIFYTREKSSGV
jgi:signal peptidase II